MKKYEAVDMTPQDFAARRKALGLTQRQLAEELGWAHGSIGRWETTHIPPYAANALKMLERIRGRKTDN